MRRSTRVSAPVAERRAHISVLSMLLRVLSTRTQRVRIVRGSRARRAVDNAHRDHDQILGALRARDALLAASTAAVHITAVEQWLAAGLIEAPAEPLTG